MELDELHLPSNEALWVKMRRKILWGDELAVESAVRVAPPAQVFAAMKRHRVYQLIESWSFHLTPDSTIGIAGTPMPMDPASLDYLEPIDGVFLYEYAKHRFEERDDVANPFVPASPRSSPESGSPPSSETKSS